MTVRKTDPPQPQRPLDATPPMASLSHNALDADWRLGLAGITHEDLQDTTHAGRLRRMHKLRRALRQERQRRISGHWAYSLSRHKALIESYRIEAHRQLHSSSSCCAKVSQ